VVDFAYFGKSNTDNVSLHKRNYTVAGRIGDWGFGTGKFFLTQVQAVAFLFSPDHHIIFTRIPRLCTNSAHLTSIFGEIRNGEPHGFYKERTMSLKPSKLFFGFLVVVLAITSTACGASQVPTPTATKTPMETPVTIVPTASSKNVSLAVSATPTVRVTPSATKFVITVTAVNGDLSIRSGPDITFDAIAALKDGETVTVLARSIMDGWVQIPIPSQDGKTGWVLLKTNYFVVNGNVLDLPRVDAVEWNVGSYLINCTPHQMLVKPGDVILPPVSSSPSNRVWFTPGVYSVYDLDVTGQPVAANLSVTGHREFHIIKDGSRKQWTCPSDTK